MPGLDENYIFAVTVNTPLPVQTRLNELAGHFAQAGWHCTQATGNIISFAKRKSFRWFLFLFLWILGGIFSLVGMTFMLAMPVIYIIYFFVTVNQARTIVLR